MQQGIKHEGSPAPRTRLTRRFLLASSGTAQRRRLWSALALSLALLLGYHALFGANGVFAYRAKRAEDHELQRRLERLGQENGRLQAHVEHLRRDPDAIEYEAHVRLRYARPDQVIVLNGEPSAGQEQAGAPAR
jgi:cell division protein FtsB